MSEEKKFCCWCDEDLAYESGAMIWLSSIDESPGHRFCVDQYDEKKQREPAYNLPKRQELIEGIQSAVNELEQDLAIVSSDISKSVISEALKKRKMHLKIALSEEYAVDIEKRIRDWNRYNQKKA